MRWLLFSILLLLAAPVEAAVVYMSGFELGSPSFTCVGAPFECDVAAMGSGSTIQSTTVHTGGWALSSNANTSDLTIGMSGINNLSCRFYLRVSDQVPVGSMWVYADSGNIPGISVVWDGTNLAIQNQGGFSVTTGTATIVSNVWTRVDVIYDVASGGVGKVYVNGVLDINTTHTGANPNVDRIRMTGAGHPYFVDDVYCTNTLVQPPDGRGIARQGIAGTPIDNAWTLAGCSGNIETCWSNTGFSTASSANSGSTTSAIAQTMVVAPFSATQAGHGTETISGTLNGCQIIALAKTSSALNNGNLGAIRRYVNGAGPTDDNITIQSIADRGYKSSVFTDTLPNLDLYQIGWNKRASTAARTQTVEDMWMYCDYLPTLTGILWFSGVETGGLGEFSQVDAGGRANTLCLTSGACTGATCSNLLGGSGAHAGCYSLGTVGASTNAGFGISKKGLNKNTLYTRFYWKMLNTSVKVINEPIFASLNAAQANQIVLMLKTDNTLFWCFGSAASACTPIASGATVLTGASYYLIETKQVIDVAIGGIEVKINGVVEFTSFGTNTSGATIDQFIFGPYNSVANNTHYYSFDDIVVSDTGYIGRGQTIARQGAGGSPTYVAWTKNSCTSSLIENCWSQTPFNATPNASSATASDAQTMLIWTFNTVQTGHGPETLNGSEVVNVCSTAAVMKSGTGSAPISIRRRLGGSDSDTGKALTTSDAYYDDQPWMALAADLVAATNEIGVVHGAGVATDTVEDMWLFCDYVPLTNRIRHKVNFE